MKAEKLSEAMNALEDKYVEKALRYQAKKRKSMWIKWTAAAACLCLILAVTVVVAYQFRTEPDVPPYIPPTYDGAYLSAAEVGSLFEMDQEGSGGATSAYTKVYRPENRPFRFRPLPTDEYVNIYKMTELTKEASKSELISFTDGIAPKLFSVFGVKETSLARRETDGQDFFHISYRNDKMELYFEQSCETNENMRDDTTNTVRIYHKDVPVTLNGRALVIDQRQSEEEIISSLVWARDLLFEVFSCSFDSVEVRFEYNGRHPYGATGIDVFYYNTTETPYRGDYIKLSFDNYANVSGETESADIIEKCTVSYVTYRIPMEECYTAEARCKLLSLAEAEALLAKGYVYAFGGHSCPICMAAQDEVSFEQYDFVEFCYVTNPYSDTARAVPFYAFYKEIGRAENGELIYAMTYVCAVELSGVDEYYESQKDKH